MLPVIQMLLAVTTPDARASSFIGDLELKKPIETPFGVVSPRVAEGVCKNSHRLFIGRIVSVQPRQVIYGQHRILHSDVTFQVERNLRNATESTITVTVPGGSVKGRIIGTPKEVPIPKIGLRYLIGTTPLSEAAVPWPKGHPIIWATAWIDKNADLPNVATLRSELQGVCNDHF